MTSTSTRTVRRRLCGRWVLSTTALMHRTIVCAVKVRFGCVCASLSSTPLFAGDVFLDFGRQPAWNCPSPDEEVPKERGATATEPPLSAEDTWQIPAVVCPEDRTFRMQIGPAGGRKGYQAITGHVGWGIAWYVNGLLIPELWVERGKTYTFIVEGGNDPENSAKNHPLYITSDPGGGYEHKSTADRKVERLFAGVGRHKNNKPYPTAGEYGVGVMRQC